MSEQIIDDQSGGWRGKFALGAVIFAFASVGWFATAALGSKYGLWSWQFGLLTMTLQLGRIVIIGTLILSIVALVFGVIASPRKRPVMLSIGALLVSGLLAGRMLGLGAGAQAVPPIHDIQTDWNDPVVLSDALMAARGLDSNPVRYDDDARFEVSDRLDRQQFSGRLIAEIQEEAECETDGKDACEDSERPKPYLPIEPLRIEATKAEVYAKALELVEARGWSVVTVDEVGGLIEATHTSSWWGFKDDVAIRLRSEGDATRVDMRSISRVGQSDLGANARRVVAYLYDLEGQRWE